MRDESRIFPPLGAPEAEILSYRDRLINRWSVYRNMHMGRKALAIWYAVLNRQWAEFDYEAAFDGIRGAILHDIDQDDVPRPITNELDPAVEQEMISLVTREWIPKVAPTSSDPRIKAAAQVATDIVNYRLEKLFWPQKRRQTAMHYLVTGDSLLYTGVDRRYYDLSPVGAETAVWCRECGTKLYSKAVPADLIRHGINGRPVSHAHAARSLEPDEFDSTGAEVEEMAELSYCPVCEDARTLEPYEPTESEAHSAIDVFGRSLGVDAPRHNSVLEVDLPFEYYPEDGGYRQSPETLRTWARRKIRSQTWLEEHAPHLVHEIEPDAIHDLIYDDPILGEWNIIGRWSPTYDSGILDNHNNVDELIDPPSFRYPLGRYVLCTKTVVIEDDHLLQANTVEGEKLYVPRAQMAHGRCKLNIGELWGRGHVDNEIGTSNRLNGIDSQLIEARLRMGAPNMALPADMWPQSGAVQDSTWGSGKLIFLQPSVSMPEFTEPKVIGGTLMPPDVYMERDRVEQGMQRRLGPASFTSGSPPPGVKTSSGLQLLIDQNERSSSLREGELVRSAEQSWSHILAMEWVLRTDEDSYGVLGPNNAWKYEQYRGNVIRGQIEVRMERGSFITKSVVDREAAREAIADQLVDLTSPIVRRKILEKYGLDADLSPETSVQVDHAERVWVDFIDKSIVRVQDSLDDPFIHFTVLGAHLEGEEGEKYIEQSGWQEISRMIAGWKDELLQLQMLEAQSMAFYGGRLQGDEAAEAYARARLMYDRKQELYEQQRSAEQELANTPGVAPIPVTALPPQPPPPPLQIPVLLQDRILLVWQSMLQKAGWQPEPPAVDAAYTSDPMLYVKVRALTEAYRLTFAPLPLPAPAPGTGETSIPVDKGSAASGAAGGSGEGAPTSPVPQVQPMNALPDGGRR